MVETDWRQILSFSEKELLQADKEELCESLSWMEVDDIELNFSDLKTLFRLAQDILKYKSEQVKNVQGELNTIHKKKGKKSSRNDNPGTSSVALETITHQEEVIKANKDILEQLYADIAELEERKNKYKDQSNDVDKDSESSPDVLSEIDAKAQLENEIVQKNKHIRKLLGYVKILEEENTKFKEKITILKDKLKEATKIIEDLTEQLLASSNESNRIKETIGSLELAKSNLLDEISTLRQEIISKGVNTENVQEDAKAKIQYLKNSVKNQRLEIESLSIENKTLKEQLSVKSGHKHSKDSDPGTMEKQVSRMDELRIKELGDKLVEASKEISRSVDIIDVLKTENKQLKSLFEEIHSTDFDIKNESDDGKERKIINELKKKNKKLTSTLQTTAETLTMKEKEILELSTELNLLQSDDGVNTLIKAFKNKKQQLKIKDEGIKSLVKDVNNLTEVVNNLQVENETMRRQLNLSNEDKIPSEGILLEYQKLKQQNIALSKEIQAIENELVTLEMKNREQSAKYAKLLKAKEPSITKTNNGDRKRDNDDKLQIVEKGVIEEGKTGDVKENINEEINLQSLIEENEGLRKGLQEIFNFLKDNNCDNSKGPLTFECPSLEAVLNALEARHAAGWFAPHIATTLQLKAALGGKDALLTALQQSRKEVFDLMTQLSKESEKCAAMESKVNELESKMKTRSEIQSDVCNNNFGKLNSYVFDSETKEIDLQNETKLEKVSLNRNTLYEQEVKNALIYFRSKYEILFDKMTEIAISTSDDKSKWLIQEENYKAQIVNLKMSNISHEEEDNSDISAGLVSVPNISYLERKCIYLEEMYKNIRTSYENVKNEILEYKKEKLKSVMNFEMQIQNLVIIIVNLTEKISCSMPEDLFWKQNKMFNDMVTKYRRVLNSDLINDESNKDKQLENDTINSEETTIRICQKVNNTKAQGKNNDSKVVMSAPKSVIQETSMELDTKNKLIEQLTKRNTELQELQANIIDTTLASQTKEEVTSLKKQLQQLNEENKLLKDKFLEIQTQYDVVMSQLQHNEHRRLNYETEINLLRHQILDLQSVGDNKAVIARLSNEILVAHLQASERHQKVESLEQFLSREIEMRENAEEALLAQQKILELLTNKYENKFRYMYEVIQTLRLEYHGGLPISSAEHYLNRLKELSDKTKVINEKCTEIEDLRFNLMTKHSVYDQILNLSSGNCSENIKNCPHRLQLTVSLNTQTRELEHCNNKIQALEKANRKLLERCNSLDKTLVTISHGFRDTYSEENIRTEKNTNNTNVANESEDSQSDSDIGSSTKESGTFTLPKPRTTQLTYQINFNSNEKKSVATITNFPERIIENFERINVAIQTNIANTQLFNKVVQTEQDSIASELKQHINSLEMANKESRKKLTDCLSKSEQREKAIVSVSEENKALHLKIQNLLETNKKLTSLNEQLQKSVEMSKKEMEDFKNSHIEQCNNIKKKAKEEIKSLLDSVERMEIEKNKILSEYKQLLDRERNDNYENVKILKSKIVALQDEIDRKTSTADGSTNDIIKQNIAKYTLKNGDLENKCFKLENNLEDYKREVASCQSELQRWKNLASERLEKMDQMSLQLKERHNYEVESYKAENQHWLMQLNETQREHIELRTQLSEQKALHMKQLAEKDNQIEQLRSVVHNLKTQIINMQTMLSVQDPSFDLSAIVEVEEASDISQQGSDRLELKFDSTVDFHDMQDDFTKISTSTMIWQEPVIERLRREKQLLAKQNGVLRRQIKAIAARERRSRLDAQNLKNQVFRISTSGSKAVCAESAALHSKIASLQAQLTSARRDNNSSVALWDKWKRAQQASERWQARYEEKCQEVTKLEAGLNMARSAVARLDKEKRTLLSRLSEPKNEKLSAREKQDGEASEKRLSRSEYDPSEMQTVPVSTRALLERIEAQQRRIVALEVAEKGNEPLVSEYEKSLAEITSLKGQVLKLESTLLETQIRSPYTQEVKPELEYWKSYCNMLKEENSQLTLRVSSLESAPATAHQHRVNDLEQTVLTLRGLVSKLQAEQKSSVTNIKRVDSRPTSGRNASDKARSQLESCKTEIVNLKRSIQEKDVLLERSKDMLKIAAEREDELLNENAFLRRQLEELTDYKRDSVSD